LSDGVNTYAYDAANRLTAFNSPSNTVSYGYRCNGLSSNQWGIIGCDCDRVSQIVYGVTTEYVLDIASPLTQVLKDETKTYVYGVDRNAQISGAAPEYFLTDGLGSVRQLVDSTGASTLTKSYAPYGETISSVGNGVSVYQFTGAARDASSLTYLRSRYLDSNVGRFISRDMWAGNYNRPLSLNRWNYVEGNPINFSDPTGHCKTDDEACWKKAREIISEFPTIGINVGIGSLFGCDFTIPYLTKYWTTEELEDVQIGLRAIKNSITIGNSDAVFANAFGNVVLTRMSEPLQPTLKNAAGFTIGSNSHRVVILDVARDANLIAYTTIHEFGHVLT